MLKFEESFEDFNFFYIVWLCSRFKVGYKYEF